MTIWLMVSATEQDVDRLLADGPRRDFLELARVVSGTIVFAELRARRRGILSRLSGPHIRQAWEMAGRARAEDVVFADGEHNGLPLLLFLALRRKRVQRVVMLGHLMSKRWKRGITWLVTRTGQRGEILFHSVEQRARVKPLLGRGWNSMLVPYQVDTEYWKPTGRSADAEREPLVVAVGSENRDYDTLAEAASGLPARFVIAAGSHWARSKARLSNPPANVEYLNETLSYGELRALYARAQVVVVPLQDVPNQSGVTTILEAMSMGLPVVVTANNGQRECVTGSLMTASGDLTVATAERGPQVFAGGDAHYDTSGIYVAPGDAAGLQAAIAYLLTDAGARQRMGSTGRATVMTGFDISDFTKLLARALWGTAVTDGVAGPLAPAT